MNFLRQVLFSLVVVSGLSLAVSAQKDDKKPPKPQPPVVVPGDKKPPQNPPRGEDKPKKPGSSWFAAVRDEEEA